MNIVWNWSGSVKSNNVDPIAANWTDVGEIEYRSQKSIPAGSTDYDIAMSFDGTKLEAFVMISTQPIVVKVNNTTTPYVTLNIAANTPRSFSKTAGAGCPLNTAITHFYVTTTVAALINFRFLVKP